MNVSARLFGLLLFITTPAIGQGTMAEVLARVEGAKVARVVGEGADGYLKPLAGISPELRSDVAYINSKRLTEYTRESSRFSGIVHLAAELAGCNLITRLPKGQMYQTAAFVWKARTESPPELAANCRRNIQPVQPQSTAPPQTAPSPIAIGEPLARGIAAVRDYQRVCGQIIEPYVLQEKQGTIALAGTEQHIRQGYFVANRRDSRGVLKTDFRAEIRSVTRMREGRPNYPTLSLQLDLCTIKVAQDHIDNGVPTVDRRNTPMAPLPVFPPLGRKPVAPSPAPVP